MANKLAGQRAKFSRARSIWFSASEEVKRDRAREMMAEVLADAEGFGFTEDLVTQGEDVPDAVRDRLRERPLSLRPDSTAEEDPEALVRALSAAVDTSDLWELGHGAQWVYAYGYRCAADRLKIGSAIADAEARVAAQISTGTPDKPSLVLKIATHDCRALERAIQATLRLRGRQIEGAGAEWFRVDRDEVIAIYRAVIGET